MPDQKNTVVTDTGLEIYTDDMYIYADEYIASLHDKDSIYSSAGNTFTGMIKYINRHMGFNESMYADIELLNNIWGVYTDLVYKYNQKPTIEEYALLIGSTRDTIYQWLNGTSRGNIYRDKDGNVINDFFTWQSSHRGEPYTSEPSSLRSDTIKKWQEECRLGRYKSAASGNVGGIFLCKAVDGMVETAPVQIENQAQRQSIEEIQQRYNLEQKSDTDKPLLEPPKADF